MAHISRVQEENDRWRAAGRQCQEQILAIKAAVGLLRGSVDEAWRSAQQMWQQQEGGWRADEPAGESDGQGARGPEGSPPADGKRDGHILGELRRILRLAEADCGEGRDARWLARSLQQLARDTREKDEGARSPEAGREEAQKNTA